MVSFIVLVAPSKLSPCLVVLIKTLPILLKYLNVSFKDCTLYDSMKTTEIRNDKHFVDQYITGHLWYNYFSNILLCLCWTNVQLNITLRMECLPYLGQRVYIIEWDLFMVASITLGLSNHPYQFYFAKKLQSK